MSDVHLRRWYRTAVCGAWNVPEGDLRGTVTEVTCVACLMRRVAMAAAAFDHALDRLCRIRNEPGKRGTTSGGPVSDDVYILFDLFPHDTDSAPGDVVFVRVRSRTEEGARALAASVAGREGRDAWMDPDKTKIRSYGPAVVQWAGLVTVHAHGAVHEDVLVKHKIPGPVGAPDPSIPSTPRRGSGLHSSDLQAEHHRDRQLPGRD